MQPYVLTSDAPYYSNACQALLHHDPHDPEAVQACRQHCATFLCRIRQLGDREQARLFFHFMCSIGYPLRLRPNGARL